MANINMIEDSKEFHESFEYEASPILTSNGITPKYTFRDDGSHLEQDMMMGIDLLLIDDDLGAITGDQIIAMIDENPEYQKLKIVYYSGGESVENLKLKTKRS